MALAAAVLVSGCGASDDSGLGLGGDQSTFVPATVDSGAPKPEIKELPNGDPQAEDLPLPASGAPVTGGSPTLELSQEPTAVPQAGPTPDSTPPVPGGEGPEGEPTTGVPGDVTGGPPGPESVTGGLVWSSEPHPRVHLASEVFDWCDDAAATIATFGRALGPGEDPAEVFEDYEVLLAMTLSALEVECDVPGGKRYSAYMTEYSFGRAFATVAEAVAYRDEQLAKSADHRTRFPEGYLLGYLGEFKREFPLENRDEVVVLAETVTVRDGAVRGLVHNFSRTQFARGVVVSARPASTDPNSQQGALSWYWPLTVQPGERAPFEIQNWEGPTDPTAIDIQVAATLSDDVDISRAFSLGGSPIGRDPIEVWAFDADLWIPTSHPHLESAILGQSIQDLRAYAAFVQDGRVVGLQKLRTWAAAYYGENGEEQEIVDIESFPISADDLPEPIASRDDLYFVPTGFSPFFSFSFAPQGDGFQLWVGGANPPPAEQPTEGQTPE